MKRAALSLVVFIVTIGIVVSRVTAAPTNNLSGIMVSPALEELTVPAGQDSADFTVQVTNHTAKPVTLYLATNDFTTLGTSGQITFYTQHYNPATNPHGLASAMTPGLTTLSLNPTETRSVPISINGVNSLAVGGHYGAVVYFVNYPSAPSRLLTPVSNHQVLSTLVFLRTAGQGSQNLQLSSSLLSSLYWWRPPSSTQFLLSNSGNTQTTPRGYAELAQGNRTIVRGLLNVDSGLILPSSQELTSVELTAPPLSWFGGSYMLSVFYRPDSASAFAKYQQHFFVVGLIWPILIILALVGWGGYKIYSQLKRPLS